MNLDQFEESAKKVAEFRFGATVAIKRPSFFSDYAHGCDPNYILKLIECVKKCDDAIDILMTLDVYPEIVDDLRDLVDDIKEGVK